MRAAHKKFPVKLNFYASTLLLVDERPCSRGENLEWEGGHTTKKGNESFIGKVETLSKCSNFHIRDK